MLLIDPGAGDLAIVFSMEQLQRKHEETNNPVYAMYAFRHCFQRRVTPPEWVNRFVAVAFHEYISLSGTKSLDECFQVKGDKGSTPAMKQFLLDERDDLIYRDVYKLVEIFDFSLEEAAYAIKCKLEEADWNHTHVAMTELTEGTIKDMYRKRHRQRIKTATADDPGLVKYLSAEEKRVAFLASFPEHCLPSRFK